LGPWREVVAQNPLDGGCQLVVQVLALARAYRHWLARSGCHVALADLHTLPFTCLLLRRQGIEQRAQIWTIRCGSQAITDVVRCRWLAWPRLRRRARFRWGGVALDTINGEGDGAPANWD